MCREDEVEVSSRFFFLSYFIFSGPLLVIHFIDHCYLFFKFYMMLVITLGLSLTFFLIHEDFS